MFILFMTVPRLWLYDANSQVRVEKVTFNHEDVDRADDNPDPTIEK